MDASSSWWRVGTVLARSCAVVSLALYSEGGLAPVQGGTALRDHCLWSLCAGWRPPLLESAGSCTAQGAHRPPLVMKLVKPILNLVKGVEASLCPWASFCACAREREGGEQERQGVCCVHIHVFVIEGGLWSSLQFWSCSYY
jgi:hypothetical protein